MVQSSASWKTALSCTASVVAVLCSGGCALDGGGGATSPQPVLVSPSVAVSETGFSCPGVPDTSVEAMFDHPTEYAPTPIIENGVLTNVTCYVDVYNESAGYSGHSLTMIFDHYRANRDPWRDGYLGTKVGVFSVPGDGGFGEVQVADEGGGSALYNCGDRYHYLLVSVLPHYGMKGDLKGNLVNMASSMVPWVCQGQPVPGLGIPMDTAPPDPTGAPTPPAELQSPKTTAPVTTEPPPPEKQTP